MGVPYYFYVITQQHPGILLKTCPSKVDVFYLDYNGGVHPVCHKLMESMSADTPAPIFEDNLCKESWNYLMNLVREIKPSNVHITLDGVAPVAKIQQQRKRRYLSILRQQLLKKQNLWDSNAISPGTPFMKKLNEFFRIKLKQTFSAVPMEFHGSDECGEGEHKIFHILRKNPESGKTHVVYGLDADLIMLSLVSHIPYIYLMREHTNVKKHEEGYVYLDIDALRKGILKTLVQEYKWPISENALQNIFSEEANTVIENYIVSCFLLGNDFLPNITCLHLKKNGLPSILHAFKDAWEQTGNPLILSASIHDAEKNGFSMKFMSAWIEALSKQEDDWMWKLNEDYMKKRCMIQGEEDKVEFYPIMHENKSPLAFEMVKLSNPQKWRSLYYKYLMEMERQDMTIVVSACAEYIKGFMWTYRYYKQLSKPYDWYYPYGYAPTLRDLYNHLFAEMSSFEKLWDNWNHLSLEQTNTFLHPLVQLMAILPKESHHLLPENIVKTMHHSTSGVQYMYPSKYPIYTYMKQHLWECHPRLPTLDFRALSRIVRSF